MLICARAEGAAYWSQLVTCKPGANYRIEANVSCELTVAAEPDAAGTAGVVLSVQPMNGKRALGERRLTAGILRALEPIDLRALYRVPSGARGLEVSVGVVGARGTARIHEVRCVEILEPEATSNVLAIPPPAHRLPAPRVAQSVCVCSSTASERPITRILAAYFGPSHVRAVPPRAILGSGELPEAVLLPDADLPAGIRSLKALFRLAADRIVVISLPAFSRLTNGALSARRVEQADDPIAARVVYANHATRGFALHDVFPFAWSGKQTGSFVQNHFRRTDSLAAFCKQHQFVTILDSQGNRDVTSCRPVCLYRQTAGGGVYVLDIEPAECKGSTFGEPAIATYFLLSLLGHNQAGLGQYVVPAAKESDFRELIRELGCRFEALVVHDSGLPIDQVTSQVVTVGREDSSFGLPLKPKPWIVVRTGLASGDFESVYGALFWFKQLARAGPYDCPYAQQLAARLRLAWIPCFAPWLPGWGWRASAQLAKDYPLPFNPSDGGLAALIDIVSAPVNRVRVLIPHEEGAYEPYRVWLPQLMTSTGTARYFTYTVDNGDGFDVRDRFAWRHVHHDVGIVVRPEAFQDSLHRQVLATRGQAVRIEVPGSVADFTAHSIHRTNLVATVLEHVIGLHYGLIAVNRTDRPMQLDGFLPLAPGRALVEDRHAAALQLASSQAG